MSSANNLIHEFRTVFKYTLPVLAGYVFLGFAFGLLMRTGGFPVWTPIIMSVIIYSGALEFAAVPILSAAFDPFGAFIIGILLSARHLFYGIPMLKKYSGAGLSKIMLMFGLTDETFSILSSTDVPDGIKLKRFYMWITVLNYSYWITGTVLGAVFGSFVSLSAEGLDFALNALFVVLFTESINNRKGLLSGISGLAVSAAVLALFGKDLFIIISMAAILSILLAGRRVIDRD